MVLSAATVNSFPGPRCTHCSGLPDCFLGIFLHQTTLWFKKGSKLIALISCTRVAINYKQHVKASDRIDLYLFGWLI